MPVNQSKWATVLSSANLRLWLNSGCVRGLIREIERVARTGARILEVGCGTASIGASLIDRGYNVTALDSEPDVLQQAKKTLLEGGFALPKFVHGDAFSLTKIFEEALLRQKRFDCVFSQGLLEHFEDLEIAKLLREMFAVGENVIFSVPSPHYPDKEYGNERQLPVMHWALLTAPFYEQAELQTRMYAGDQHILGTIERTKP